MSDPAAVLWLDQRDGRASQDEARRALAEWARTRGVRLAAIEDDQAPARVDPSLAERVERELDRAREAIAATEADAAERALARVDAALRGHPELPQAAWLRAEAERAWSARWQHVEPRDEDRARVAWENAQALDGGRIAGVGERNSPPRPRVKTAIIIAGAAGTRLGVHLDGVPLRRATTSDPRDAVYQVEVAPAEHQLVATLDDRVVFAAWIAIAGAAPARVTIAPGRACARAEFSDVKREGTQIRPTGVSCPRWVAATEGERPGSVMVARCERDVCGPLLEWRLERLAASGPPQPPPTPGWPAWATWTLLGVGAATATSLTMLATGVFERRPVEPRFVVGGARQE